VQFFYYSIAKLPKSTVTEDNLMFCSSHLRRIYRLMHISSNSCMQNVLSVAITACFDKAITFFDFDTIS